MLTERSTVLLVDDDDRRVVRRLIQRLLSEAGYRTFEAENGAEALDVVGVTGHMDLVIVDVVMPRINGTEFVRELLERYPQQRVLYMSAHPAELLARYQAPNLEVPFLAKPFTRKALYAVAVPEHGRGPELSRWTNGPRP